MVYRRNGLLLLVVSSLFAGCRTTDSGTGAALQDGTGSPSAPGEDQLEDFRIFDSQFVGNVTLSCELREGTRTRRFAIRPSREAVGYHSVQSSDGSAVYARAKVNVTMPEIYSDGGADGDAGYMTLSQVNGGTGPNDLRFRGEYHVPNSPPAGFVANGDDAVYKLNCRGSVVDAQAVARVRPGRIICPMVARNSKPYLVYSITVANNATVRVDYQKFPTSTSEVVPFNGLLDSFTGGTVRRSGKRFMIDDVADGDLGWINLYDRGNGTFGGRITFSNSGPEGLEGDGRGYNLSCRADQSITASVPETERTPAVDRTVAPKLNIECRQTSGSWAWAKRQNTRVTFTKRKFVALQIGGNAEPAEEAALVKYVAVDDPARASAGARLAWRNWAGFHPAYRAVYETKEDGTEELYLEGDGDGDAGYGTLVRKPREKWIGSIMFPNGDFDATGYSDNEYVKFECLGDVTN